MLDKDGNEIDHWISVEGESHKIDSSKLIGGETYTLHEVLPPEKYSLAQDVSFTVNTEGKPQTVYMKDDATKIQVTKTDITGSKELGGAKLVVKDKNGDVVESETYTLHEEISPDGYAVAKDIVFTVNMDETPTRVQMKDETTKVHITKTDITGSKELGGAKLVVKDKNGNVVDSWTSAEGETHIIEGKLIAGETYILHEEQSPDGYAIASDVIFEVGEDGKVSSLK